CYANTKCQTMNCGANVTADGGGSGSGTVTVSLGNNTTVYGNITDVQGIVSLNGGSNVYGNVTYAPSPNGSCSGCASPVPVHGTYGAQTTTSPTVPAVQPCGTFTSASVVNSNITPSGGTYYTQSTGDFSLPHGKTVTIAPITGGYCFHTVTVNGII